MKPPKYIWIFLLAPIWMVLSILAKLYWFQQPWPFWVAMIPLGITGVGVIFLIKSELRS